VTEGGPWLVVGLGNPGERYAGTRHNAGEMVLGTLAGRVGGRLSPVKGRRAAVLEGRLAGERVALAVPMSYMNESGGPVKGLLDWFKIPVEQLIVVHDELDVPFGRLRLKRGGGAGGHNGLRSIDQALLRSGLGNDYLRVRVGVDRPPGPADPDYVLKGFKPGERKELPLLLEDAADAVESLLTGTLEAAQQKWHAAS
jgi:PTH1 family peptidyl-tRNA hydrolase